MRNRRGTRVTMTDHMTEQQPRRASPASGKPLFAQLDRDGRVIGVTNGGDHGAPSPEPMPQGNRYLPLFGADVPFDLVTEVREGPVYTIEADRVMRSYTVRPKLAAELLREICWWYGALHSSDAAQVSPAFKEAGLSPSEVNDTARASLV